jgi:hydrogenase assembly chaperone HypC/HupF
MCISIPTKVIQVIGKKAVVESLGFCKEVFIPFENILEGDWVLVYAGAVISQISAEQAMETLELLGIPQRDNEHESSNSNR